jgi:hypothetical protein
MGLCQAKLSDPVHKVVGILERVQILVRPLLTKQKALVDVEQGFTGHFKTEVSPILRPGR